EEWTKLELEFEAPAEGQNPQIWLLHHHYNAPEGVAWFDDISVVAADGPDDNLVINGGFEGSGDAWRVSAEYSVRGLDDGCVIVSDGEEYWISGASGEGETRQFNPADSVSVTARAFQIGGGTVDLAAATALNCGDLAFTSDTPVDLSLDLTSGEGLVRAEAASAVSLKGIGTISAQKLEMTSDTSMKVASGEWAFGFETDLNQPVANAAAIWQAARKPGAQQQREYPGEAMQTIWELSEEAETQVNTVDAADIDNDGSVEVVAGLQDGTTIAIDDDGTEIFRHTADGPINDVCCADLAGETPVLLVASDDYTLYALDPAGETIWEFSSEGRDITTKLAGELGTGRHVSSEGEFITIEIDDIDGDGTPEILAGAKAFKHGNRHVYGTLWVLSADGELLWHVFNFGGTVDTIDAADIDGDGEKEITFGTGGGTYGRRAYLVQPGGELIAQFSGPYGEKRAAFGQLQEGAGPAVVRLERANGSVDVYAASEEAELLWTYPTSGLTTVGPFVRDFDGDGLDEICVAGASGDVYMLGGGEEHLVWRTNLGQPVACMDVAEVEGNPVIALGTYSGHLFTVNASGEITAHAHLLSGITSLTVTQTGAITAGLENGTVAMVR
ncbi:MAG: VCBS repeat-containing protein, partial [Armatimonadota bacterium]